jgi:hypothetical protein
VLCGFVLSANPEIGQKWGYFPFADDTGVGKLKNRLSDPHRRDSQQLAFAWAPVKRRARRNFMWVPVQPWSFCADAEEYAHIDTSQRIRC